MQAEHDNLLHEELPPYLANLGLLSDPFADAPSGHFFYVGADGEQRLDLMHHLAPYSPLLVVIGELGSGKTALLQQFAARAKDNWRIIAITARIDMDRDDFMTALSEALGMPVQSQVDPQLQYLSLIAQLRALRQTAQVPILLIDDAQNLSTSLLELIHKLCSENDDGHIVSVILFGTPQLQNLWNKESLAPLAARVTHTFEVAPFTEEETARYIRHRLRAAGASEEGPFDSVTINKIHAASGGIPSRINEFAHQVLVDRSMGNNQRQAGGGQGGTTDIGRRRRALTIAGVVVVVALLVAGPLRSILFKPSPLPPPQAPQSRSLSMPFPAEPTQRDSTQEERVVRSDGEAAKPPTPAPSAGTSEMAPSSTETVKTLPLPPEGTTTVMESAPAEQPEPAPEKNEQPMETAEPLPSQPAKTKQVAASPPSKKTEELQNVNRSSAGLAWLKAQAGDSFTLQLMAVRDEETARRFIEIHSLQDKAAYFPVKSKGRTLYALVYGSFPQHSEAVKAAKNLPASWSTPNPWIRSFKSLPPLNR